MEITTPFFRVKMYSVVVVALAFLYILDEDVAAQLRNTAAVARNSAESTLQILLNVLLTLPNVLSGGCALRIAHWVLR